MKNRIQMMIDASSTLARIESLDELLLELMVIAKEITKAEASSVMLYNPEKQVLEFKSIKDDIVGEKGGDILKSAIELKLGEGIGGWVAENRKSVIIDDAQNDQRLFKQADKKTGFMTCNLIAVPILHRDELLGVIETLNSKDRTCFDDEDREILESFASLAAVAIIRSRLMDFRLQQQKIMVQLDAAAKIQTLFLPKESDIESLKNVWATSIPAGSVGGDLYDIIPMNDKSLLFYVGDVSGKGLPAALIMAALSSRIRGEAYTQKNVAALLERVNNAMFDLISDQGYFATIIIGRYWPDTGMMHLCNAGHLIPLWITQNALTSVPYEKNLPVGILKDVSYKMVELFLSPGDRVIFLSDGITEAQNEDEKFFGDSRVEAYIRDHKAFPLSKGLVEEIKAWRGTAEANDDLTILEIWR